MTKAFSVNRRGRFLGAASALVFVGILLFVASRPHKDNFVEHAVFISPDGRYKVVVMRERTLFGMMPGQAGDSPGEVQLKDSSGHVIHRQTVEMVQLIESVEWQPGKASIKLVAEWDLQP